MRKLLGCAGLGSERSELGYSRNTKSGPEAVIEHLVEGRANPGELRCM